jgi:2-keto-4-pentenoate hydratase/2-oxohepta-3-ene-1,7-dioic acid hydratase in catechol pathway
VLWLGTDGAQQHMKDGDLIAVEINDISVLRNPLIKER